MPAPLHQAVDIPCVGTLDEQPGQIVRRPRNIMFCAFHAYDDDSALVHTGHMATLVGTVRDWQDDEGWE